ncbi:uncharacterized protein K444DRAFT_14353 [Hyaloscypha bicolor E]|uniref:Uncharacterized protein n=1 Tax=Hyaloscypha bicolor E TaxID=1095630 RepID=A0A2J6TWK1_9HELO|nr:uncharacterized protein K444DRAFT_14353 [Hyaloscypha bicolor E]PMD67371.1 hypothetical protein K444DRAFT_14353 [Hyaloscypha bicolor E]
MIYVITQPGSTAPSRRPYRDCTSKWRVPAFPLARLACASCMHRPLFSNYRASTRDVKPHLATSFQYICSFKNESVQYTIRICPLYEIDSDLGSQPIGVMLGRRPVEPGYQTAMRRHASRTSKEAQYRERHIIISMASKSLFMRKGYSGRTPIGQYFRCSTLVSRGSLFFHFPEVFVAI